jgi:hypothetical protein
VREPGLAGLSAGRAEREAVVMTVPVDVLVLAPVVAVERLRDCA